MRARGIGESEISAELPNSCPFEKWAKTPRYNATMRAVADGSRRFTTPPKCSSGGRYSTVTPTSRSRASVTPNAGSGNPRIKSAWNIPRERKKEILGQTTRQNVRVFARFRPLEMGAESAGWTLEGNQLELNSLEVNNGHTFSCALDGVFTEEVDQWTVYETTTKPGVDDVLAGINASIFCYGQTGTGKCATIGCSTHSSQHGANTQPGPSPRCQSGRLACCMQQASIPFQAFQACRMCRA